jgi:ATP-dependent helicase HrpA
MRWSVATSRRAPFFAHNQKLVREIENLEHKSRRLDVLVDDELIIGFYDKLIPHDICNGVDFEKWHKEATAADPKLLYLNRDDLMRHEAAGVTTDLFPKTMNVAGIAMALTYHFEPGAARWRDADRAAVCAQPGVRGALRMAGAGHAEGEGAPAAEIPAAETAPPLRAAARLRGAFLRAHGRAQDLRPGQPDRRHHCRHPRADHDLVQAQRLQAGDAAGAPCDELQDVDEHGRQLEMGRNLAALQAEFGGQARQQFQKLAEQVAIARARMRTAPHRARCTGKPGPSAARRPPLRWASTAISPAGVR